MRWNKRASLEIGVNTIVILVIAMMLLGLGIGFIRGLFSKANTLPSLIDTNSWENPPTSTEPVKLTPSEVTVKGGDSIEVKVGIYNKAGSDRDFTVAIPQCTNIDSGQKLIVSSLSANIPNGESKGFKVIITASTSTDGTSTSTVVPLTMGKYICKLQGIEANADGTPKSPGSNVASYDSQFIMTVTT